MKSKLQAVVVADASLGYGSPQIPALARSLADYYSAEAAIIEPDTPGKPARHELYPDLTVKRLYGDTEPYTLPGRIQYLVEAAKEVDRLRPDILVVVCTYCLPLLLRMKFRPPLIIYYSIESIVCYGDWDVQLNRAVASMIDLIIFPEENRAANDLNRCGFHSIPMAILYNCSADQWNTNQPIGVEARNGRIISQGAIASEHTFADYYLNQEIQRLPIDLYGPIVGHNAASLSESFSTMRRNVRYLGHADLRSLAELRRRYSFSIVIWNPGVERGLYAPSNKFFEAIQDGVPPITAPHPQHKLLAERYQCGLVMKGWSFESFYEALLQALELYGTDRYAEMVANCQKAVREELNWETQFNKVKRLLPKAA